MKDDDSIDSWTLDPSLNKLLRLKMIEKCRHQGRDQEVILEAEELLDLDPQCAEALFYLGEAFLQIGDAEGALQAFEQHIEVSGGQQSLAILIGKAMAHFELCQLAPAEASIRAALTQASHEAQAHFVLGLILEISPNGMRASTSAFVAANQLDPERYPLPLSIKDNEWKQLIELALQSVNPIIRNFWEGLPVHLFASPDINELSKVEPALSPRVLGLYIGKPPRESDEATKPEGLRLFTRNLTRSRNHSDVVAKIAATLEQEAVDWLGDSPVGLES